MTESARRNCTTSCAMRSASAGQRPSIVRPPRKYFASGIGFCNTKSTLLIALLRAVGIPARVHCVTINRRVCADSSGRRQNSSTTLTPKCCSRIVGSAASTVIVDRPLHRAAVARCRAEKLIIGYGVHSNGSINWDGRTDCFAQFANDGIVPDLSDAVLAASSTSSNFAPRVSPATHPICPSRLLIRWLTQSANRRVHELRSTDGG